jgi:hydroxymethylpyrimidine pyrophosphatase-like HAD family hydrolase
MIRLIATDLDGTLLDSDGLIPEANQRALERAIELGVRLVLATARKEASTTAIAQMLGLPCARIAHNGARIWDWSGQELRHYRLPIDFARAVASFADAQGIGLIITVDEVNYYGGAARALREKGDLPARTNVEALVGAPTRIIAIGSAGINLLCAAFGDTPDSVVLHRYYSRVGALESAVLTHPRATKETALEELCAAHGIEADEVLALGDAEADAGMLRWAGVGVAMANAMDEARAAADWIAPSHDAAGVAAAIERYVFRGNREQGTGDEGSSEF